VVYVALDDRLSLYSFPNHPFNNSRYFSFKQALEGRKILSLLGKINSRQAEIEELLLFHTPEYIDFVKREEAEGGYLDFGDTPAFKGVFKGSRIVVGTTLNSIDKAIEENTRVFNPVGGLHHAYRDKAGGFCVFNDIGVGINYLRKKYKIKNILYFDIDAHHGDGVFYSFLEDPNLYIVDFHQRGIFPGTGEKRERGEGRALGTKLNIELKSGAEDRDFFRELKEVREFLDTKKIDFILMQAGCDCLAQDPLTFLNLTEEVHREVTKLLLEIAEKFTKGRMVILGGGGYLLENIKKAWPAVIEELLLRGA